MGIEDELAELDACKVEHLVSDVTAEALALFLERKVSKGESEGERSLQVKALEKSIEDGRVDVFPSDNVEALSVELEKMSEMGNNDHGEDK